MSSKQFWVILWSTGFSIMNAQTIPGDLATLSKYTLEENPIIATGVLAINSAKANLKIQSSSFDYQLSSIASVSKNEVTLFDADPRASVINGNLGTNSTDFSMGLQKTFRSGRSASLSLDYGRLSNNFPFNQFNEEVGADISDHTVTTSLSLTQPLLKGRGKRVATALEKSSALAIESTQYNYELTNSFEILQMGIAYWQYLGAFKSLSVFEANEKRVRDVLEITNELVKADKKPAGDLIQIKADLANQERQTKVAEQNFYNARLNLGRAVGLQEKESEQIGTPVDEFPSISSAGNTSALTSEMMIEAAINQRTDIKSFQKSKEGLELQLGQARNNLSPTLNLSGFVSYGGMNMGNGIERAFASLGNRQGRNYTIGVRLNFLFPLNNNLAKGSFLRNKAALAEQQVTLDNLQRNIKLNVNIALNNVNNSISILEKAKETLQYYEDVFGNEQIKFQNGLTTLLNLILFQERLTFAQLDYLQAQQQFAIAILNLRFETGMLVKKDTNGNISLIDKKMFYEIPKL